MNETMLNSFFDEVGRIEKVAAMPWGALGTMFGRAGQGAKAVMGGIKGAPGALPGTRKQLIMGGLKEMAPAAALTGGGLLAGYGAKKALFG